MSLSLEALPRTAVPPERTGTLSLAPLLRRLLALALLFICELVPISIWLDNELLSGAHGLVGLMHTWGAWVLKSVVAFAALFVTCAYLNNEQLLERISSEVHNAAIRSSLLALHLTCLLAFCGMSYVLYGRGVQGGPADMLALLWMSSGLAAIALGATAFIPVAAWRSLARGTGYLWIFVAVAIAAACVLGNTIRLLWAPAARLTLALVNAALVPFLSGVTAAPATMSIGTARFSVEIAKECSGLEGIGLILAFTTVWLVLFRKECRFPNALLLLPAGVVIMFLLNALRIAALVLIGNAGAERIALGGFHSQAGWIAFNAVALGLAVGARRLPWVVRQPPSESVPQSQLDNPTAAYLLPFVAILATGMAATALSSGFEWLYPLRFLAAAAALWHFRKRYAGLGWRCTWAGPATGVLVFTLWIAFDRSASAPMPAALAAASAPLRDFWIFFRALSAIITVPIAEELAFRAYAVRRLIAPDFEAISLRHFTWMSLILSSVLFGALHGGRWFAGTLAGVLYGLAMLRRGRIGDAVIAHATTNAMLAAYVLTQGKWNFW